MKRSKRTEWKPCEHLADGRECLFVLCDLCDEVHCLFCQRERDAFDEAHDIDEAFRELMSSEEGQARKAQIEAGLRVASDPSWWAEIAKRSPKP